MKTAQKALYATILLSFLVSFFFYSSLPDEMVSQWGPEDAPRSSLPRLFSAFLIPVLSVAVFVLFLAIPRVDPLSKNIEKFQTYYDRLVLAIILFLFYIHLLTIAWNLGTPLHMARMMAPAVGILFYYTGVVFQNSKKNWFVGVVTPWALSDDKNWERTHETGGKLFKLAGFIAALGLILPDYSLFLMVVPIIFVSIYTILFSFYLYWRKGK